MALKQPRPSPETLARLIDYDPETGVMIWRPRKPELFKSIKSSRTWNSRFAGKPALACTTTHGYGHGDIVGAKVMAHRVAWALATGVWPEGEIDHINGVRSDNRLVNLRDVPRSENLRNKKTPCSNTSGHIGIYEHKPGVWRVRLGRRHVALCPSFDAAASVWQEARRRAGYHANHGR